MQDTKAAQARISRLLPPVQDAYLVLSIEHAFSEACRVGAIPGDLKAQFFEPAFDVVWNVVSGASIGPERDALVAVGRRFQDRLEQELQHNFISLVSALNAVLARLSQGQDKAKNVLNMIDDFVSQSDPDEDEGATEEGEWRDALLDAVEQTVTIDRATFRRDVDSETDWGTRWLGDWAS